MTGKTIGLLIVMAAYLAVMIIVGAIYSKRNKDVTAFDGTPWGCIPFRVC